MKWSIKILFGLISLALVAIVGAGLHFYSQEAETAAVLAWMVASKQSYTEGRNVQPIDGVFELVGQLSIDEKTWESSAGSFTVPHMALSAYHVRRIDLAASDSWPSEKGGGDYVRLDWQVIEKGYQGVYGIDETLEAFDKRRVRIVGKIYDGCGHGTYLGGVDGHGIICDAEGILDNEGYIELHNVVEAETGETSR